MWKIFYNFLVVPFGWLLFQFLGLFDRKVRRGIDARKGLFDRLSREAAKLNPASKRVWFHSSSMGEFEQAKPIIAELRRRRPDIDIIISFFSPSGFEHSLTYRHAAVITYIPFDSSSNAREFIGIIRPSVAVMVRYDVWPNHLWELQRLHIPTFIANATLRLTRVRRLPVAYGFYKSLYECLDYILTVSPADREAFLSLGLRKPVLECIGDSRFDQVVQRSAESRAKHVLPPALVADKRVLVAGSSWPDDEDQLLPAFLRLAEEHSELLLILVPHEPTLEHLERAEYLVNGRCPSIRFSNVADYAGEKIIIIDSIGVLMSLYKYAHVVYVGGSFKQGIHNVLEPAVYGVPLVIGPRHQNSQEAEMLVAQGGAFVGTSVEGLHDAIHRLLCVESERKTAGDICLNFVRQNVGATDRFLTYLERVL